MSIIRKESVIKKKTGDTVYIQKNVQNVQNNLTQVGYDQNFIHSVNTNTDLSQEIYRHLQQLRHETQNKNIENKKKFKETNDRLREIERIQNDMVRTQNEIIEAQNKLLEQMKCGSGGDHQHLLQQHMVVQPKRYASKEIGCITILNLLFRYKFFEYLSFRSFFSILKSMKLWESDKKNELREHIKNNNVYNICRKRNLEIIVIRNATNRRHSRGTNQHSTDDIVSLIKCLIGESESDMPLNNLYELFKDINMFKEDRCVFKQLLMNENFRIRKISTRDYVGI